MAKSTKECSVEGKIETLQRHFGGIVSTVKDLKANLEALRKSFEQVQSSEVQEMVETKRVNDEIVVANSDSLTQIKSGILQLKLKECVEACKTVSQSLTKYLSITQPLTLSLTEPLNYTTNHPTIYTAKYQTSHPTFYLNFHQTFH